MVKEISIEDLLTKADVYLQRAKAIKAEITRLKNSKAEANVLKKIERKESQEWECPCGNGFVMSGSASVTNDINDLSDDISDYHIECSECANKYHFVKRYGKVYLVPIGEAFKTVPVLKWHKMPFDLEIYYKYGSHLDDIIEDFTRVKSSSKVLRDDSREVAQICRNRMHTVARKKILDLLYGIKDNDTVYAQRVREFFDVIHEEKAVIRQTEAYNEGLLRRAWVLVKEE